MVKQKQKYKPKKNPHATQGVISIVLALLACFSLAVVSVISFAKQGNIGAYGGTVGLLAALATLFGFSYGMQGCKEEDRRHVLAILGILVNGGLFICMIALFGGGMYA